MNKKKALTTSEVAKYCSVNIRTVLRWIDSGKLKSFKLPGRGDNRIVVSDFINFLNDNKIPIPIEFADKNKNILVIEDEELISDFIKKILESAGYNVAVAINGFAAGSMLETFHPKLVTIDLSMPGMDGFEVLDYIKSDTNYESIKILIISAGDDSEMQKALKAGADDFMFKPVKQDELIDKINKILS